MVKFEVWRGFGTDVYFFTFNDKGKVDYYQHIDNDFPARKLLYLLDGVYNGGVPAGNWEMPIMPDVTDVKKYINSIYDKIVKAYKRNRKKGKELPYRMIMSCDGDETYLHEDSDAGMAVENQCYHVACELIDFNKIFVKGHGFVLPIDAEDFAQDISDAIMKWCIEYRLSPWEFRKPDVVFIEYPEIDKKLAGDFLKGVDNVREISDPEFGEFRKNTFFQNFPNCGEIPVIFYWKEV